VRDLNELVELIDRWIAKFTTLENETSDYEKGLIFHSYVEILEKVRRVIK